MQLKASKLEKAYQALELRDYFKAKNLFNELYSKEASPEAAYGLATIYFRNDNPFYQIDSALKYAYIAFNLYPNSKPEQKIAGFTISKATLLNKADSVTLKQFTKTKEINTVKAFDDFLENNYLCQTIIKLKALQLRDELEFTHLKKVNRSDSTKFFLLTHPFTNLQKEVKSLIDKQLFEENTKLKRAKDYIDFIKNYPNSEMLNTAYEKLFSIYKQQADAAGLAFFAKSYPKASQNTDAWKQLFSLTVKSYTYSELKKFIDTYPDFPLKNSILKELELNKLVVYPYAKEDFTGFIDEAGKIIIKPMYDAATDFYEGLAVVNKNDTVFFINKNNENTLEKTFTDAHVFKDGIAPVKQGNKWHFINRQGQEFQKYYDEVNEISDDVYVVKIAGKYGALSRYGQPLIEPVYDKLGDFKNDYAYYSENGLYGYISKNGTKSKAEFEWISDFDTEQIALFKQNGKFGLLNSAGKKVLEPQFDLILKTSHHLYTVVLNNLYGFFNLKQNCFQTSVTYEFQKDKPVEYYTNGRTFKLLKKNEQALMDENGSLLVNYGACEETGFFTDGLIRLKRKGKYGFVDKKLVQVIPFKWDEATDFSNGNAIVKSKENYSIIDTQGLEIFSSPAPIEKLSKNYFVTTTSPQSLITSSGAVLHEDVAAIQRINNQLLVITLSNGEIKLLKD